MQTTFWDKRSYHKFTKEATILFSTIFKHRIYDFWSWIYLKTMISYCLQSLSDLCGIRVAYLMWTRRNVPRRILNDEVFNELVNIVSDDVSSLPLPEQWKRRILKHVSLAGKQLLTLLNVWTSKTEFENSLETSLENMLFESLVLNADGQINRRQTAEKILWSNMLPRVFAFRLACINFLEKEVLKLWIYEKEYFLNKIIFCAKETEEVLFWIFYCLSKENSINIKELPHFSGIDVDWHEHCLESATFSGNVACFDYFKNFCGGKIQINSLKIIKRIFNSTQGEYSLYFNALDYEQSCLIFHFLLLNSEEKEELFCQYPKHMVCFFLNWPLSQTFVENTEEIWNLIPNENKSWVFIYIFKVLFGTSFNKMYSADFMPICMTTGKYILEHVERIWIDLWKISLDTYKRDVLNKPVFLSIKTFIVRKGSRVSFNGSNLKQKLLHIFLLNGEAVLELYRGQNMKESLRSLVAKYLPEDFDELDRKYISYLKKPPAKKKDKMLFNPLSRFWPRNPCQHVDENCLNYIREILFSLSRN